MFSSKTNTFSPGYMTLPQSLAECGDYFLLSKCLITLSQAKEALASPLGPYLQVSSPNTFRRLNLSFVHGPRWAINLTMASQFCFVESKNDLERACCFWQTMGELLSAVYDIEDGLFLSRSSESYSFTQEEYDSIASAAHDYLGQLPLTVSLVSDEPVKADSKAKRIGSRKKRNRKKGKRK